MTHLSSEEIVLTYYGESETAAARAHLRECAACRDELARLSTVLDRVRPDEIEEPPPGYEAQVWSRLQWRLRGEENRGRLPWGWMAAAAALALAFVAGLLVSRRNVAPAQIATTKPAIAASQKQQRDRVLLYVVGDHLAQSERVLIELTNLTPDGDTDITTERERAETLLASNRIYRRSARETGEDRMATILDELEPVLLQIARSDERVSADDLRSLQKRVESRGLVFKLRVVRAGVQTVPPATTHPNQGTI